MRIARYIADGTVAYGVIDGSTILPVLGADSLITASSGRRHGAPRPLGSVGLQCPVAPMARNPFCVGWNYEDHFAEGQARRGPGAATEIPDRPTFFTKATSSLIGPGDNIKAHRALTTSLDWEVELVVVIGRSAANIREDNAMKHVLGFTIANDVSARDVQREHGGQWFRGKSLDRTSPIGPWVVTADELEPLEHRAITCRVNGETVQSAVLGDLHFGVARVIAELSRGLTLMAGDVILTGTPSGVGFARTPPRFLAPGDVVESEIEGIGVMRNQVAE